MVELQKKNEKVLQQEIEILRKLDHRHIVKIFKSWVENPPEKYKYHCFPRKEASIGVIFIETEYCSLNSLRHWFRKNWRNKEQAKTFMYQITSGVKYLHDKGIIHRDLKPENVLLQNETSSNSVVAKICDFGVSRQTATVMTATVGTFGYISPEVMQRRNYNKKADVYSLGVMFYEMLLLGEVKNAELSCALLEMKCNEMTNYIFQFLPEDESLVNFQEKSLIERMVEKESQTRIEVSYVLRILSQIYPGIEKSQILYTANMQISKTMSSTEKVSEYVTFTNTLTEDGDNFVTMEQSDFQTVREKFQTILLNESKENPIKKPVKLNERNEIAGKQSNSWQEKFSSFISNCKTNIETKNALVLTSFFAPTGIDPKFVVQLMKKLFAIDVQNDVFEILEKHSMCQRMKVGDKDLISVDPILQEIIRQILEEEKQVEILDKILDIIYKLLKGNEVARTDLIHAETLWKHSAKIKKLVRKHHDVPVGIAYQYSSNAGNDNEGLQFCCAALEHLQSHLGIQHPSTLKIMYWKGEFHGYLEEFQDALTILREVHENQKIIFGEKHEDALQTGNALKKLYRKQEEAKNGIKVKKDRGVTLLNKRKYKEAENLFQEILLPLHEKVWGKEHQVTLIVKDSIAWSKECQGKYDEALKIYEQVFRIQEKVLGNQHPVTLIIKRSIERTKNKCKK